MNSPNKLRIALGQLNLLVGDVAGNAKAIVAAVVDESELNVSDGTSRFRMLKRLRS